MSDPVAPSMPSPSTFGPPLQNFGAIEDPSTEMDARAWNNMRAQLAMISQTVPLAMVAIQYSGGVVTILRHSAVWGDTSGVAPTAVRNSAGSFTFQWATDYPDLRDDGTAVAHAVSIRGATVTPGVTGSTKLVACYILDNARTVSVNVFNDAGTLTDPNNLTLVIW